LFFDWVDMPASSDERLWVGTSEQLAEGGYLRKDVEYAGEPISVVVFRYKSKCLAYRNLCVHMPRELDCERNTVFDATGKYLRCSMHGIVYDPMTGVSVSSICNGERLTPIGIMEDEQGVWITDRRVKPLALA
jgi:nitrite reductase/ring-hydroxylating ferredoxin subunit